MVFHGKVALAIRRAGTSHTSPPGPHQSALSCVAAALVATKQKEKLFTGLLFADGGRGDLFEHVVDLQKVHAFPVQTDYKYLRAQEGLHGCPRPHQWYAKRPSAARCDRPVCMPGLCQSTC